jgi:hypothetical protein
VAEHVLEIEDDVEEHREDGGGDREGGDRGSGKRGDTEEPKVEHRALGAELDRGEGGEQCGTDGEAARDLGARPAFAVAAEGAEDE